ncbi:hypothetical protein [Candidatus Cryosericum septentrionale]|uniref:Uncharacterized protein n=1 Tax=Candidatus Cryosericum septentrionale TaxID=2290913 RepID=A0A398DNF3_9BACT|nr:hypothetical protein [Candidatus Cryosericum septentrionale]RIE15489.1 hypothetical protein SMC1_10095 [Candidatus Cryosericum septentrionale]
MEDKLKAAITAYAEAQSKVLDRVFDNLAKTGSPSSADLAFCPPHDIIAGLPQEEQYDAFLRKLRFLGYAMWKSSCYHQVQEHATFEAERMRLIERFSALELLFQEGVREGHPAPAPAVGPDTSVSDIGSNVAENGCTLFLPQGQLEILLAQRANVLQPSWPSWRRSGQGAGSRRGTVLPSLSCTGSWRLPRSAIRPRHASCISSKTSILSPCSGTSISCRHGSLGRGARISPSEP